MNHQRKKDMKNLNNFLNLQLKLDFLSFCEPKLPGSPLISPRLCDVLFEYILFGSELILYSNSCLHLDLYQNVSYFFF